MRVIFAAMLWVIATPVLAEWVPFAEGANGDVYYIDYQSIQKDGNFRKASGAINYFSENEYGIRSHLGWFEFDCKEERFRQLSFSVHQERLGQGNTIGRNDVPEEWRYITSESIFSIMRKNVCRK